MVQSDVPQGRTKSGKVNARWYLQRLRASANSRQNSSNNYFDNDININKTNRHDTIRVVRGSTATQGQHIPRIFLKSPTRFYENESIKQKSPDNRRSNSIHITSATSLKSTSTINKKSPSLNEFNSSSYQSIRKRISKDEKENLSERRSSSGTLQSIKVDLIARPPSTPVDPRCHRAYSSTTNPIDRQTCSLLGPQLCSDCIEIQMRANLSPERLPANVMNQRLSALALRRFLKNEENLTDDDLLKLVNNQQIQMKNKNQNEINSSIISDDEYFDRLSSSLSQNKNERPFYFKDLKDFSQKYQTNKYERLLLSETPAPQSANPIFKQSSFEKFDVSSRYSFMTKASTIKPNLKSNLLTFLSTKKIEQLYKDDRYLNDPSPPLLLQALQETVRKNSNKNLLNKYISSSNRNQLPNRSFISSKSSHRQTLDV
ncbi:unnamed protein product [Rotaria magnacalcarata]|uniref:Uncharacterized protein n=1 Tax=Rotaria magnacalcarata TaxID=392030 RepID=A0A819KVB2_9BILA|nr:unnamed protein product [Rotaria magnacalcarata]CAF1217909.1 unnamed protein product [Rotaria magnacalcarata]CAF2033255.1 unnamed protein product [Rotaria magnacalcarata]CAF2066831.1 unnamed protein product [Rotaria magnacalcarata]CAF2109931.1 unnamed protein product [Rotaria magnacalcarata]